MLTRNMNRQDRVIPIYHHKALFAVDIERGLRTCDSCEQWSRPSLF